MTVTTSTSKNSYVGNGVTTVFSFTFKVFAPTDIQVYKTLSGASTSTILNYPADYAISINPVTDGGTITPTVLLNTGDVIVVNRNMSLTQPSKLPVEDKLPDDLLNNGLDRPIMITQQLQEQINRALSFPITNTTAYSNLLPTPTPRSALLWDSAGLNIINSTYDPDTAGIAALAAQLSAASVQTYWVSVTAYGADPSGVHDSTAAILQAIATGNNVYFPPGTYIISANLPLLANQVVRGAGKNLTIIKFNADNIKGFTCTSINYWAIRDIGFNGGGQTTNVNTGRKAGVGIAIDSCKFYEVTGVNLTKMGIMNSAGVTSDSGFGGFGILIQCTISECAYGTFRDITSSYIAGGGNFAGDGIYIGGQNSNTAIKTHDLLFDKCVSQFVGRHAFSISSGAGTSIPSNITLRNCTGLNTALAGIDLEPANNTVLDNCTWYSCGNDQTFYNPATTYGATYRLMAAIAIGNSEQNTTIIKNYGTGNYYGITYGTSDTLIISKTIFENSVHGDAYNALAGGPTNLIVSESFFNTATASPAFYFNSSAANLLLFDRCSFAFTVNAGQMSGATYFNCVFKKGYLIVGGSTEKVNFLANTFLDWAGPAIAVTVGDTASACVVDGNHFLGTGNMTNAIQAGYNTFKNWIVQNNDISGTTGYGIYDTNSSGDVPFAVLSNNTFNGCAGGIRLTQGQLAGSISGNQFTNVTNYCMLFDSISGAMNDVTMIDNTAVSGCTNGLQISLGGGSWDRNIIQFNNFHNCSGTKWSLPGSGNTNGFVGNNITT
jgi:hypothetical protein